MTAEIEPMIIDTSIDVTPHLPTLKAAGVTTIIGYIDPIGPDNPKQVTPERAKTIAAAGIRLGLVSEGWGDFAHGGISAGAGERDGRYAAKIAPTLGAPEGGCIFFAVDTDASAIQIQKLVLPYFAAVRSTLKGYRVGVYGSGAVCAAVLDAGTADLAWLSCSLGWAGSEAFLASKKWALRQQVPGKVAGVPCDGDDANGDFGDFVPFAPAAAVPAAPSIVTVAPSRSEQFMTELAALAARYSGGI